MVGSCSCSSPVDIVLAWSWQWEQQDTPLDFLAVVPGAVASAVGSLWFPESDDEYGGLIQS